MYDPINDTSPFYIILISPNTIFHFLVGHKGQKKHVLKTEEENLLA